MSTKEKPKAPDVFNFINTTLGGLAARGANGQSAADSDGISPLVSNIPFNFAG
jgi:hypothetical protein